MYGRCHCDDYLITVKMADDLLRRENNQNMYRDAHKYPRQRQNVSQDKHQTPTNINKETENQYLNILKCFSFFFVVTIVAAIVLGYFLHQKILELEKCNIDHELFCSRSSLKHDSSSALSCQRELEKWEKLFRSERADAKDMVDKIVSDAESYVNTKTDLDVCRTSYWYTLTALMATWGGLGCIILTYCCCCCCCRVLRQRQRQRYEGHRHLVAYER